MEAQSTFFLRQKILKMYDELKNDPKQKFWRFILLTVVTLMVISLLTPLFFTKYYYFADFSMVNRGEILWKLPDAFVQERKKQKGLPALIEDPLNGADLAGIVQHAGHLVQAKGSLGSWTAVEKAVVALEVAGVRQDEVDAGQHRTPRVDRMTG